ncbi:D-aminoacyl-tRNA deacylase [Methanocaldococcus indicus]|uniref:D-aminoacyl-tRNA deacylase n=1 Tax=Methanocaldococcus indicus TaxID=213231 RepID=UPI003C6CE175
MKYLFISSKKDLASLNIAKHLEEYFDIYYTEKDLLDIKREDLKKSDYYIFLSKHRSERNLPSLTVHVPGLLDKEICPADAVLNTLILKNLNKYNNIGYNVSFEVVHHTPTDLDGYSVFVEIGSSEKEWTNEKAGKIVANAIVESIECLENQDYEELDRVLGIGGGHYAPKFTKLALQNKYYFGYLVPKYINIKEDILKQMLNKSEIDKVLIDWKGCKSEMKKKCISFFENSGIEWEKV